MGILSGIGKSAAKISRKVKGKAEKALTPKALQHELSPGQKRVKKPTTAQSVTQNLGRRAQAIGEGKGRVVGGAVGLGLGTVAGGATVAALSGDKDKKKTGGAKASTRKKVTVKKKPSDSKSNGRVDHAKMVLMK